MPLQLEFVFGACANDGGMGGIGGIEDCVEDMKEMWRDGNEFGFDADVDGLELMVKDMCYMSYDYVLDMGLTETQCKLQHECSI